jgi:hypothetical protein
LSSMCKPRSTEEKKRRKKKRRQISNQIAHLYTLRTRKELDISCSHL